MLWCTMHQKECVGFLFNEDKSVKLDPNECEYSHNCDERPGFKVMPDFSSSGLWNLKTGVMIHVNEIACKALEQEFDEWIKYYDVSFEKDYATWKPDRSEKVNSWGRALARKVKELYPEADVVYIGEDEKGILEAEKVK